MKNSLVSNLQTLNHSKAEHVLRLGILSLTLLFLTSTLSACSMASIAEHWTEAKSRKDATSPEAQAAIDNFWTTFHTANYEKWDDANFDLVGQYLENPGDPELARLVGFSHMWRLSERNNLLEDDPRITDSAHLAELYFRDAEYLDPSDKRVSVFLASSMLTTGSIQNDEKKQTRGYFKLLEAKDAYPEFNLFTAGYVLSGANPKGERYREAINYIWENIEVCADMNLVRGELDRQAILDFYSTNTGEGKSEKVANACYNSWKAPHNLEGFFMNFGDMLLKQGQTTAAKEAYLLTKALPDYATWPHQDKLELRLSEFEARAAAYKNLPANGAGFSTLDTDYQMFQSNYSCMGCHQKE